MKPATLMRRITENAIDFLTRAIEGFQEHPKYSIINFYAAVELFLKARLLHEHWSLVVARDPDKQKFEAGDFVSITFEGACERLHKVVQSPLPEGARKNFDAVRKHRNKMVHFFHPAGAGTGTELEAIAREQLRAWYDLHQLLTVQWAAAFRSYGPRFAEVEGKLKGHREYLRAKFDALGTKIADEKKKGATFIACGSCGFQAARQDEIVGDLFEAECLVCGYRDKWLNFTCPECDGVSPLREGGEFVCDFCGHTVGTEKIAEQLNEFVTTKDNYFEAIVPANCTECYGYHTVVEYGGQYMCVVCFTVVESLSACGFRGEHSNGDMEDSYMVGCSVCEGSAGWVRDKED